MSHIQDIVNDIERPSNLLMGERSNFLLSLMALSVYIIRIDGDFGMQKQGYVQYFVGTYYEPAKAQRSICATRLERSTDFMWLSPANAATPMVSF